MMAILLGLDACISASKHMASGRFTSMGTAGEPAQPALVAVTSAHVKGNKVDRLRARAAQAAARRDWT